MSNRDEMVTTIARFAPDESGTPLGERSGRAESCWSWPARPARRARRGCACSGHGDHGAGGGRMPTVGTWRAGRVAAVTTDTEVT
jgi:hypothetical protein